MRPCITILFMILLFKKTHKPNPQRRDIEGATIKFINTNRYSCIQKREAVLQDKPLA